MPPAAQYKSGSEQQRGREVYYYVHTKNKQQISQKAEDKIWGGVVHAGG